MFERLLELMQVGNRSLFFCGLSYCDPEESLLLSPSQCIYFGIAFSVGCFVLMLVMWFVFAFI